MKRLNISFTDRQMKQLDRERKKTDIPTSVLLRQLIDRYFRKKKATKENQHAQS